MTRELIVQLLRRSALPCCCALVIASAGCGPDQSAQTPQVAPPSPAAPVAPAPDPSAAPPIAAAQDRVTLKREPPPASGSAAAHNVKHGDESAGLPAAKHADHANATSERGEPAKASPVANERAKPAPAEPAREPIPAAAPTPTPPPPAHAAPAPAATKVVVPRTDHVHVDVPKGLQAWLDADTRMQPWVATVMRVADRCYAQVRESNAGAAGTIEVAVTMHKDARPDADILALPPQLSGIVACGTGDLIRSGMPLFTGNEGERYTLRLVFQ
jgi:hypothetical protein